LLEMALEQGVEQRFVAVLQVAQVQVLLQIVVQPLHGLAATPDLGVQIAVVRWQKAVQRELIALGVGECRALVVQRIGQQLDAVLCDGQWLRLVVVLGHGYLCRMCLPCAVEWVSAQRHVEALSRSRPVVFGPNRAMMPASRPVQPMSAKPTKNDRLCTIMGTSSAPTAPPAWPMPSENAKPV